MSLEITVIYADDRVTAPRVRRAPAVRAIAPSRLAGCATLLASAIWLFVVWFPLDSYLDMCVLRRTTFAVPAGFDLGAFLFGRTPIPADLANPAPPSRSEQQKPSDDGPRDDGISAYRSPAAAAPVATLSAESSPARGGLPVAVYSWVALMTAAGLALALLAGAGIADWLTRSESVRPIRLAGLAMLLLVGVLAALRWPRGGDVPGLSSMVQFLFGAAFFVVPWACCTTTTIAQARRISWGALVVLAIVAWVMWGRYGTAVPEIAQRTAVLMAMVLASLLGAAFSRLARRFSSAAGLLVLAGIVVTLALMVYVHRIGGFVEFTPTAASYITAAILPALALLPLWWVRAAAP